MKIVITGVAGFIGSNLAKELLKNGHEVIGIDNLSRGKRSNIPEGVEFYELSIVNFDDIVPLFDGVDYVYHLAALARVRPSVKQPLAYNDVNTTGTLNVIEACRLCKVNKIIFSSSSSVFGDQPLPYTSETPKVPMNPYAMQKLIAEQYLRLYKDLYGLNFTILRFYNVYGPGQIVGGAYATAIGIFIDQMKRGKKLTIFGDGTQRRDFTHVRDTVDACIKAADKKADGLTIDVGRGNNKSVNEIAALISSDVEYLPPVKGEARETLCDNTYAKEILGWEPQYDVDKKVIEEMINAAP